MALLFINAGRKLSTINKNIYGHFAEHLGNGIYNGIYVGEDSIIPNVRGIRCDVVEALRKIQVPVLRWPGGCFAEYYNWKDGVGPDRKRIVNAGWGAVVEDNSFGTHEFLDLCEQVGCSPYIAANVGSGTPREVSEWIEYMTFSGDSPMADWRRQNGRDQPWKVEFVGVGNENWACGGNMRPEYYADVYRRFETYVRNYGESKLYRIACGANGGDYEWTEVLMKQAGKQMDGLSLHYYTMPGFYDTEEYPWEQKGHAVGFDAGSYYRTLRRALYTDELIRRHKHVMDQYDPQGRVSIIMDEWGTWHQVEPGMNPAFLFQQNTMRDAMVAAVSLNIFNSHSDRVHMANLAQMVNVLQSVILTEGDKLLLTPTYHVFDLFKGHQDATLIESYVQQQQQTGPEDALVPALHVSASERTDGKIHVTLANLSMEEAQPITWKLDGKTFSNASIRYISGDMNSHNSFGQPPQVEIQALPDMEIQDNSLELSLPACCVAEIILD
ncbi:alpha-N-arabinofuranosidase [Paenibacillus piscarius]|uniref:alpha-N-arabinofuranosidase n=1 Tax=Paenibacillus piscarius TaxID=1089681 RepID=UPI001EE98499|nr:alpha-L-arabinofuranosidase C-terminal domain-containing protein [Paenibacillus piscarius]